MNTNSKNSTDKTHSGAVCQIIGVLFGLFAFIWLPTPEVDAQTEFTVITGLVRSELNQLPLAGVQVAVSSAQHAGSTAETEFNGEYIVIVLTTDSSGDPIPFPIEITFAKEGFQPTTVMLQESEEVNGVITRDVVMIGDFDGDGISDATENASPCLDANDADTDDDGIIDGDEDTNKNGVKDSEEIDPCRLDTDNDDIQDGTELGLTLNDIGSDTDTAIFQPDLDPSPKTNPLDADSDNDGLLDGEEDLNRNGRVDAGETDPNFLNDLPSSSSLHLESPPDCELRDPPTCPRTDNVTVFRWTRSENPLVHSYHVIFSDQPQPDDSNKIHEILVPPKPDEEIPARQVALFLRNTSSLPSGEDNIYFWRVFALDGLGNVVEESPEIFAFWWDEDGSGFTVISGIVNSDLRQAALVGARVAVASELHSDTFDHNNTVVIASDREYILIVRISDQNSEGTPISAETPLRITATQEGFKRANEFFSNPAELTGVELFMESEFDGDGIPDAVENASPCPDAPRATPRANDADTDDDGIADGEEDTNFNGIRESNETDPCESDTDRDLIQDGTERGYTIGVIDHTDTNIFQPDLDPSTTTNPLDDDSDNDGLLDGTEDLNHNGRVDADAGETDPNSSNRRAQPHIPLLLLSD